MISFALKFSPHSPKNMSPPFIWLYIYFYNRDLACTNPLIRFLILCALKNIYVIPSIYKVLCSAVIFEELIDLGGIWKKYI